jgi:hypothetical protein
MLDLDAAKSISQILAGAATTLAVATFWFYISGRYSKRVEFDVALNVYHSSEPSHKILKRTCCWITRDEHRCYTLAYEVVEMRAGGTSVSDPREGFIFDRATS